jgi:putative membrane protein insertion efficiency factor
MRFKSLVQFPFILMIRIYKYLLSPLLPNACRYNPTCSQYAEEAIKKYGILKGIFLGAKRIARCHPWGGHGYDPLP